MTGEENWKKDGPHRNTLVTCRSYSGRPRAGLPEVGNWPANYTLRKFDVLEPWNNVRQSETFCPTTRLYKRWGRAVVSLSRIGRMRDIRLCRKMSAQTALLDGLLACLNSWCRTPLGSWGNYNDGTV